MSLSKRKCWYSNNHLQFLKRAVPLTFGQRTQCLSMTVINLSTLSVIVSFSTFSGGEFGHGLYYKHMTIVNDDYSGVSEQSIQLIDDTRGVIYNRRMFIIQATDLVVFLPYGCMLCGHTLQCLKAVLNGVAVQFWVLILIIWRFHFFWSKIIWPTDIW